MSDEHQSERAQFGQYVRKALAENPQWLETAIWSISSGMEDAHARLREKMAACDLAMRCAIMLTDTTRLTQRTKQLLNSAICEHLLNTVGSSQAELEFLHRHNNVPTYTCDGKEDD